MLVAWYRIQIGKESQKSQIIVLYLSLLLDENVMFSFKYLQENEELGLEFTEPDIYATIMIFGIWLTFSY